MNLELLKRFYVVAEEGGLIKAAQKLNVVPSALTKSITNFEYQLKTELFERLPKGMNLTCQGERLYIFC
jgi:DNA-binding transcriptional LysR family regulator